MSFSNSPTRPPTTSSSSSSHLSLRPGSASTPAPAPAPAAADTVDIPLDEPASQHQFSPTRQYYNYCQHQQQQQHHQFQSQHQRAQQQHQQQQQQQQSHTHHQQPAHPSHPNNQVQLHHLHSNPSTLIPNPSSPRHIPPTFLSLHRSQNPHSPSPVLHALSSTLSTAFNSLNQLTQAGTTAIGAAAAPGADGVGAGHGPGSGPIHHDAVQDIFDSGFVSSTLANHARTRGAQHSLSSGNINALAATTQPPQALPAAISWTSWTVRPAGNTSEQNNAGAEGYDDDDDEPRSAEYTARAPALIVGYSSGALQVYVFGSSTPAATHQSAALDELCFLPRLPVPTPTPSPAQPASTTTASSEDKHQRPRNRRRSSVREHASAVHGAVFLSADVLLVLAESNSSSTGTGTATATGTASGTRALNLIALSLPDSSPIASDSTTKKQRVPKAVGAYQVRELGPNEVVVSAQLRASGTSFLAVALTTLKLDNPLAALISEIHALRISTSTSTSSTSPLIYHACAPLRDLPPGVRPTMDLCGRVLVYAACMPSINTRDRAAGGNFIAAAGAFGSQNGAAGTPGEGAGLGGDSDHLNGDGGGLGGGSPGLGGGAGGGAAAAMRSLGHRAAAAGLSSMSALTAAAAARFSPSSIGSPPTGFEGGMGQYAQQQQQQQQLMQQQQQQPGWEQHASAAASAISIGAGAGVDAAKRVGSGVLSGVRGLSGYLGAASSSSTAAYRAHPALSSSSSPPYVPSQLSRSAPSSQGGVLGGGRLGLPGFTSTTTGFTSTNTNTTNSVDRAPATYVPTPAQQRRFSGSVQQQQHRNSISQRAGAARLAGGNLGSVGVGPNGNGNGNGAVEETVLSPTDSPVLQPSSHEEILPASQGGNAVAGPGPHSGLPGSGAGMPFGAIAAVAGSSSPSAHAHQQQQQQQHHDAASFAGSSVGSKRFSGHSLASAAQGYAQGGPAHAFSTSMGQPSSFTHLQAHNALARANLVSGPVWVRVVDLGSAVPPSSSNAEDPPVVESLARPRTLALFRPPNSSLGLLSQVGLGWSAGTNAAAAAALLSSSSPRSPPPPMGGPEYASSFSSSMAGVGAGLPFGPASPVGGFAPHTMAPSLAPNPVALLSLSPDGSSLLTADALGQVFHVWEMMPCPAPIVAGKNAGGAAVAAAGAAPLAADGRARRARAPSASHGSALTGLEEESLPPSVWHRYKLSRGLTSAQVVGATWSADAQFVFVQSQKGTVHAYPVNPHGGAPDVGKHLQRPGTSASVGNKVIGLGTLSVEVKAIARLRPVDVPTQQPIALSPTTDIAGTMTPTAIPGAPGRQAPVPTIAAASLMLLNPKMTAEPPSLIPSDLVARKLQLLVYHPSWDMVLLHSFACVASPSADVDDPSAGIANGGVSSDRSASGHGSLMAGLPRSVSAPVAAAATGVAAAASSGLSRMISRTGSTWGSAAAGVRGGDPSAGGGGLGHQSRPAGRIFSTVSGGGSNGGHAHGLMGDSVAFAAWCGLARVVLEDGMPEVNGDALDLNGLELGEQDEDEEEIGLGDDAEALEKRALFRDRHLRHGSSPLSRPALQVAASEVSSPSGSDEEGGARVKTTDTAPILKSRPISQAQIRLQAAESSSAAASQSSSTDMTGSASPKLGEGKKTTMTTGSPAQQVGKKKRKGSTKAAGSSVDAAIPVLELPPSKTTEVTQKFATPAIHPERKQQEREATPARPSLPPFRLPSWVTQIEVETYSRAPRVLPPTIWLSHQFEFCEFKPTKHARSGSLHTLYKKKTSKIEVREEVKVDAPAGEGDVGFDKGLMSAIEARAFDSSSLGSRLGGANGGFSADGYGSQATWKLPMFPQGQRARHPAWHERVIAAGGVPIRNVAGGLGHGLGRAGREIGRSVEEAVSARRKRLSSASSGANDVAGFEAFEFEDDIAEGQGMGGGQGQEGASTFLEVRAAKEAAGLSVEDLPATEIDSDDEQTWKDARKANQGLDDEFEGWDGFAAEGCAPPQAVVSAGLRRGQGYMVGLLEEDGGVGRPASRPIAPVGVGAVPALKPGRRSLALAASSGGGSLTNGDGLPPPAPTPSNSNSTKSTPTSSSKVSRSGAMPGSLPLPATTSSRSSSSPRRKADPAGSPAGTASFDLYSRQA